MYRRMSDDLLEKSNERDCRDFSTMQVLRTAEDDDGQMKNVDMHRP